MLLDVRGRSVEFEGIWMGPNIVLWVMGEVDV